MKVRIGTLNELTGSGYEILVDVATRSIVLARFYDGSFICEAGRPDGKLANEPTLLV